MSPDQFVPKVTRVVHEEYGFGTVLDAPGKWVLVQFDAYPICASSVHIDDLKVVNR